ncbi:MAG: hypothetical protein CM15mP32_2770 [Flavobacteriaceae bacterium]|nr:MAG: hypothetical protein CM15mP32_2770 [Flavobacteriaceae bacterium]
MVSVLRAQEQRQINSINFDHVTNSEGLMHNSIDPIYQDSRDICGWELSMDYINTMATNIRFTTMNLEIKTLLLGIE